MVDNARKGARKKTESNSPGVVASGVPWEIPSSWTWTTVHRVGGVRLGRQRSPETESSFYPTKYLRAGNIKAHGLDLTEVLEMDFDPVERQTFVLKAGDVVLAEASGSSAQVGRAAIWSDEIPGCCFQNTVIRFRPHAVTSAYALLAFQHFAQIGLFAAAARGVGIQHLGTSQLMQMPFPLPPISEQERIAAEANRQFQREAEARESIESALRRNAQQDNTILEAAALGGLVDFPAVDFAVQSDDTLPNSAALVTEPAREEGYDLNGDFIELFGRTLPPGWHWIRVDQAGEVRLGRQRAPEHEFGDHLCPYLRVANVFEDRIDVSDVRSMNFTPEEQKTYRLKSRDILLNEGQSPELVGRPAMYVGEPARACFQNALIRFRAAEFVNPQFALLVFRHYFRSGQFTRAARWSTNIAHLGAARFASMPFPLPPLKQQNAVVAEATARLDASKAQRLAIESSLERLPDMRREILRSALTGTLVPQGPDDEPAEVLLARLGPPLENKPKREKKENRMVRRVKNADAPPKPLYDTLITLHGPIPPERLFEAAGYNRDSTGDIEAFYLALRAELGHRIRQQTSEGEFHLEAIVDAPR